ncbi:MAG: GNAT family N-acetyltransferase [Thermoplasmata archaeon]
MSINSNIVLKDGTSVLIRECRDDDIEKLKEFVNSLSDSSIEGRFMQKIPRDLALELLRKDKTLSIVAIRNDKIIGHGAIYQKGTGSAEIAILVSEDYQSKGLGTSMLGLLTEYSIRSGVYEVKSYVSPQNYKMIGVLKNLGFPVESEAKPGVLEVRFPPSSLPEAIDKFEHRDAISAVNAVKFFLEPKGIAIIGASGDRNAIGGQLFFNLIESDYQGPIFPVNPSREFVQGIKTYKSILDIPYPVDVAFIVVPYQFVNNVARECGQKGVKGLIIISSGFSEVGGDGVKRQQELMKICSDYGMRVIGPNCMGVANTDPKVNMNGQFSPFKPRRGRISFLSQSGALGIAVIDITNKLGLGMSSFVSVGNKADISGNDLIQYWEQDANTDVILMYLESFGNPTKFSRIAKRVSKTKPIIVVKSGRFGAGFRATQSHTGALLSASDVTVDALFKQSGVIRAQTLDEMFDLAALLSSQPVPKGNRVAIVTNAGGAGILAADACEAQGLKVPELTEETQRKLREFLPPIASVKNPVDMSAAAGPEGYEKVLDVLKDTDYIDSIIVIFIPPVVMDQSVVSSKILSASKRIDGKKTIASVFMAYRGVPDILIGEGVKIPSFPFPEDAASALAKATEYGKWKYSPLSKPRDIKVKDREEVKAIISNGLKNKDGWLTYDEASRILQNYGIPVVKTIIAKTPEEIRSKVATIEGNVVVKAYGPKLVHKSDMGAVKLNVLPLKAGDVAADMLNSLKNIGVEVDYFVVQEMIPEGIEMIVGSSLDPSFGPVVVTGMGGKLVELLKDISIRLAPVSENDADEMISELKTSKVLYGYRGGIVADVEAYKDIITRISSLVYENPEIMELDLNPVLVMEKGKGAKVVDFRIRVGVASKNIPFVAKNLIKE